MAHMAKEGCILGAACLLATACPASTDGGGDTSTSTVSSSSTDTPVPTTGGTEPVVPTTTAETFTTTDPTVSTATSGVGTDTMADTTTGGLPACEAFCMACMKDELSYGECVDGCSQVPTEMCVDFWEQYLECYQGAGCPEVGEEVCTQQSGNFNTCMSTPMCGNCFGEAGETCDDGNTVDGDGCSSTCQAEDPCGNGVVGPLELCDDGNDVEDDECTSFCGPPTCGNGKTEGNEECDDGFANGVGTCLASCKLRAGGCGEGVQQERQHHDSAVHLFLSHWVDPDQLPELYFRH